MNTLAQEFINIVDYIFYQLGMGDVPLAIKMSGFLGLVVLPCLVLIAGMYMFNDKEVDVQLAKHRQLREYLER